VTTMTKEKYHKLVIQNMALKQQLSDLVKEREMLRRQLTRIQNQIDKWSKTR